jgi:hypothetical protein
MHILGKIRMHTILDFKSERSNAENNQSLKKRLRQASTCSLFTHDDRSKLAVITYEDELLSTQYHRHHAFRLGRLHALVNKDGVELEAV